MESDDDIYYFILFNTTASNIRKSITDRLFYKNSIYINGCYALNEAYDTDEMKECVVHLFKQFISAKIKRTKDYAVRDVVKLHVNMNDFIESSSDFCILLKKKNGANLPMLYDNYDVEFVPYESPLIRVVEQCVIISSLVILSGYVLYYIWN